MSSQASVYRRVVRRETHSPRAGAAITVAVAIMLIAIAARLAAVHVIVHPPVWAAMRTGFDEAAGLRSAVRYTLLASGVVAVLIGVLLVVLALRPGRRPRRRLASSRAAVIADDKAIARSLARAAAEAAGTARSQIEVVLGRRWATVRVTPTAGVSLDREAMAEAVAQAGTVYGITRHPRIIVMHKAVVG